MRGHQPLFQYPQRTERKPLGAEMNEAPRWCLRWWKTIGKKSANKKKQAKIICSLPGLKWGVSDRTREKPILRTILHRRCLKWEKSLKVNGRRKIMLCRVRMYNSRHWRQEEDLGAIRMKIVSVQMYLLFKTKFTLCSFPHHLTKDNSMIQFINNSQSVNNYLHWFRERYKNKNPCQLVPNCNK